MVEVFKTNVCSPKDARRIIKSLTALKPVYKINFDLEDCDKILRVEGKNAREIDIQQVMALVKKANFEIEVIS